MTLPRTAAFAYVSHLKAIAKWMDNGAKKPRRDYRRKPALKEKPAVTTPQDAATTEPK